MFEAGTRVIAENARVVVGFTEDSRPIYGRVTIQGRIAPRSATKFVDFNAEGRALFEPAPRRPTLDQTGHYWVEDGNHVCRMFHESELRRDTSIVFVRPAEKVTA